MTITRIELDAWGTLIDQKVIATDVASHDQADEIIDARDDSDDPLVRYVTM